tara:strand:+ start:48 stop:482 length:435 start_codon:yes stop_codon:yes gene_type:complete
LATKRLSKKPFFDKKKLTKDLDKITSNVAKKGVFVVDKDKNGLYSVKNYFSKKELINELPFARVAKSIAQWYNKKPSEQLEYNKPRLDQIKRDVDNYFKHRNDVMFYKYTMSTTDNSTSFYTAEARCDVSKGYLEAARQRLFSV